MSDWFDAFADGDLATLAPETEQPWSVAHSSNAWAYRRSGPDSSNLEVKFLSGAVYVYYNAAYLYDAMHAAPSKGKFVWRYLRDDGPYSVGNGFSYQMTTAGAAHWKREFGPQITPPPNPHPGRWVPRIHKVPGGVPSKRRRR